MTLGYHAPLPPARTGIADYASALASGLKHDFEIALNPVEPCNVELYHLGNNELHRAIYKRAIERPGVVVLHDAVLNHFFLGALSELAYVEELVFNYGEWSRALALDLWRSRARSGQDARYFRYPMLRRIAERSRAIVVHNPAAARMVREHCPEARIFEIPHLFVPPAAPDPVDVTRLRSRLGVPPSAALFGVFGFLRESKRVFPILRAFRRLRRAVPNAVLLLAGSAVSSDLERATTIQLPGEGVHRVGYLPESEFWLHAAATDICINLRHPTAGESSGIAIRMMGIGKPVMVTAGEETSRIPAAACVRVDTGAAEEEVLAKLMHWLAGDAAARRDIGQRAAEHIAAEHSLEECAGKYAEAIRYDGEAARRMSS